MSKTFKSVALPNVSVSIKPSSDGVRICSAYGLGVSNVTVSTEDAPALALAILEAAGVVHHDPDDTPYEKSERTENMGALNMSAFYLAKHVNDAEKAEFLAKEQAKLEAEALELFKASGAYGSDRFFLKFSDLEETTQSAWLAVARRAREMGVEK